MEERSFRRVPLHCPTVFVGSHTVGKGTVTDLSVFGCAVKTTTLLRKGDYLCVKFTIPEQGEVMVVNLAAVRWALGSKFGLEFVHIGHEERVRLRELVTSSEDEVGSLQ